MRKALLLIAALTLVAGTANAQSLTGSYVAPLAPSDLCVNTTYQFMFDVWNASTDAEWVDIVEVTFPPGFAILGNAGYSDPSWSFGFTTIGQTAQWYDSDGGWGEIYGQDGGQFWCDANTGPLSGNTFEWHLSGDDWGVPPHDVYGTFIIPVGSTATEPATWGGVKALYN